MGKPIPYATKVTIPLPSEEDVERAMGASYKRDALDVTKMLTGRQAERVVTLRAAVLLNAPYARHIKKISKEVSCQLRDGTPTRFETRSTSICYAVIRAIRDAPARLTAGSFLGSAAARRQRAA